MVKLSRILILAGFMLGEVAAFAVPVTPTYDPQRFINSFEEIIRAEGSAEAASSSDQMFSHVQQAKRLKKTFFEILGVIDDALLYWQDQKDSPYRYLINKGPQYWVKGIRLAEEEIAQNIATLQRHQEHYAAMLGKMSQIMQRAKIETTTTKEAEYVKDAKWVELYKKAALNSLKPVEAPSHFKRYWVRYTAAGLGLAGLGLYAYAQRDKIAELINRAQEGARTNWNDHFVAPVKDLSRMVFPEPKEQIGTRAKDVTELGNDVIRETSSRAAAFRNSYIQSLKKCQPYWDATGNKDVEAIADLSIRTGVSPLDDKLTESANTYKGWFTSFIPLTLASAQGTLAPFLKTVSDLAEMHVDGIKKIDNLANKADKAFDNNRLTITLLQCVVPAGSAVVSAWLLKKGINFMKPRGKDFQPIRTTLADLHRILNKYTENQSQHMSEVDEGLYTYYANKLVNQVFSLVEVRLIDEVMKDVRDLTSQLSSRQKVAVIDRMYRTHAFLNTNKK